MTARPWLVLVLVPLFLAACGDDPTELVVIVDSDLRVPEELDRVEVSVEGPTATLPTLAAELAGADAVALPLTLGVSPAGAALGPVTVHAEGLRGGLRLVRASARTTLVRGESRVLRLFLARSCVGSSCRAETTCREGTCVELEIPWSALPRWEGRLPPRDGGLDAGGGLDGGAGLDAGDAGSTAEDAGDTGSPPMDAGDAGATPDTGPEQDFGPPLPCPGGCDDGLACSIDRCDSMLARCVHVAIDADGDGHADEACGGDDCDDADRTRFPGATEACDGDDDDCDGALDDGCPCTPLGSMERCTTSCGAPGMRSCAAGGWSDCAPGAESCNARDDDCDGLVDEGFAYVASGARQLTSDTLPSRRPVIAAGPTSLAVAYQRDQTPSTQRDVQLLTLGLDGSPLGSARTLSAFGAYVREPAIATTGDGFVVVWSEEPSLVMPGVPGIELLFVDAAGASRGARVRVEDTGVDPDARVSWTGTQAAVVYEDADLYVELVSDAGLWGSRARVSSGLDSDPAIAWDGAQHVVAFRDRSRLAVARGTTSFASTTLAEPATDEAVGLALTSLGAVVASGQDGTLRAFVSVDGASMFGAPIVLSTSRTSGTECAPDETRVAVVSSTGGEQVLVLWSEDGSMGPRLRMARLSPDGTMLQPPGDVAGADAGGPLVYPAAAWIDTSAAVVWSATRAGCDQYEVWFASVGCP